MASECHDSPPDARLFKASRVIGGDGREESSAQEPGSQCEDPDPETAPQNEPPKGGSPSMDTVRGVFVDKGPERIVDFGFRGKPRSYYSNHSTKRI